VRDCSKWLHNSAVKCCGQYMLCGRALGNGGVAKADVTCEGLVGERSCCQREQEQLYRQFHMRDWALYRSQYYTHCAPASLPAGPIPYLTRLLLPEPWPALLCHKHLPTRSRTSHHSIEPDRSLQANQCCLPITRLCYSALPACSSSHTTRSHSRRQCTPAMSEPAQLRLPHPLYDREIAG
jgi:hypothetical protein